MSDTSADNASRLKVIVLMMVAGVALAVYLLLLRQWPETPGATGSSSLMIPMVGFGIALCAGIAVGLWWPSSRAATAATVSEPTEPESPMTQSEVVAHTDDTPTVSALMEEEHIPGSAQTQAQKQTRTHQQQDAVEQPPVDRPTAALQPSIGIDDRPRDEAMAAKDEVIRALENIVKDNRDRWAAFEQDRDELDAKIRTLETELRIAHQIIENGGDEHDVFVPPQVLGRA